MVNCFFILLMKKYDVWVTFKITVIQEIMQLNISLDVDFCILMIDDVDDDDYYYCINCC